MRELRVVPAMLLLSLTIIVPKVKAEGTLRKDISRENISRNNIQSQSETFQISSTPKYQQLIKSLVAENKPEQALEVSEKSKNRSLVSLLSQGSPTQDSSELKTTESLNINQIKQVAKKQNATLVEYSVLTEEVTVKGEKQTQESELLIWVVKPTGEVSMRRIDLQARLAKRGSSLWDLILGKRRRRSLGARSLELKGGIKVADPQEKKSSANWQELHQILIQPIADLLPKTAEEKVVFIPQSQLFRVSFAALQDSDGKYLIEKHTISTAPSIQVLDLLHQRKLTRQDKNSKTSFIPAKMTGDELLIVGNPTAPKEPLKIGDKPLNIPPLPGTEEEANNIAKILKTQALTGDAATETEIIGRMSQARIIHLATYTPFKETENSPGVIALTSSGQDDGWLRTEEVQKLNLKADLVVLAGCDTALGRITGDGVIGLSRSFMSAGADSVIGSLWLVPDQSTATLMTNFYSILSKNPDKATALRQAMLETMKKYPNPKDWAGFTLVGLL